MTDEEKRILDIKDGNSLFNYRTEQRSEEMCNIAFFKNTLDEYKYIPDKFKTFEMTEKYIYSLLSRHQSLTGMKFPREHLLKNNKELQIKILSTQPMLMWGSDNFSKEDQDDMELVLNVFLRTKEKKEFLNTYENITRSRGDYSIFNIPEVTLKNLLKSYSDKKLQALLKLYKD